MAAGYRGNHLLIPFGGDFTFSNARMNFENMDRLIDYFNKNNGQNIKLIYSTPSEYIDALYEQKI
jgi:lysosomal alpha-mannosidase